MDNEIYAAMIDATRFTRAGRLNEATQLIQRALQPGGARSGAFTSAMDVPKTIQTTLRLTAEPLVETATAGHATSGPATRQRSPKPRRPLRPPLHRPGGLPLPGMPGARRTRGPLPQSAPAGGQWIAKTHTSASGAQAYKLYVPSQYRGQSMPLVVMLHGCTQVPDDFAAGTAMNFLAEEAGFLVAYPAQTNLANASKCWNWFQPAHQQRDKGEPAAIADITREVMAEYKADAQRIYIAGMSAGGAMAAIMALAYPDLYAAVGVHSGLAAGRAHDLPTALAAMQHGGQAGQPAVGRPAPNNTTPLIIFHGDHDATVHPCNAEHLIRQWATGPSVTTRQGQAAGGRAFTCETYRDARGQVVAERWIIHGAGHTWSGGNPSGSYTDSTGPSASREMMRFFQEHPRAAPSPAE